MPILTACFHMQQGGNGGQEEVNQRRNTNEQRAFIRSPLPRARAALFSATNKHERQTILFLETACSLNL